jgi:hypothetical protein
VYVTIAGHFGINLAVIPLWSRWEPCFGMPSWCHGQLIDDCNRIVDKWVVPIFWFNGTTGWNAVEAWSWYFKQTLRLSNRRMRVLVFIVEVVGRDLTCGRGAPKNENRLTSRLVSHTLAFVNSSYVCKYERQRIIEYSTNNHQKTTANFLTNSGKCYWNHLPPTSDAVHTTVHSSLSHNSHCSTMADNNYYSHQPRHCIMCHDWTISWCTCNWVECHGDGRLRHQIVAHRAHNLRITSDFLSPFSS